MPHVDVDVSETDSVPRMKTPLGSLALRALGGGLCLLAVVSTAFAQQGLPEPDEASQRRLIWNPSLALTDAGYDSNVFNDSRAQSDLFATAAAGLSPVWRIGNAKLSSESSLAYTYFHEFVGERGLDAKVGGRVELPVAAARVHFDGNYINVRQRLNYEVDQRARREESGLRGGIDLPVGDRTTAVVEAHREQVDFADEHPESAGLPQTLNRRERGGTVGLRYDITPLTAIALTGDWSAHRFEFAPDRDGERARVGGSVTFAPLALIAGSASVSWQKLTVRDEAVSAFTGLVAAVDLSTRLGTDTHLGFGGGRDVSFSSDTVSPYYVQNSLRSSLKQGLGNRWDVGVHAERATLDYAVTTSQGPREQEQVVLLGGTVGYRFAGGLRIGINLESLRRTTQSNADRSFNTRRVFTSFSQPLGF